ncbi:MAG: DUF6289 family protein [Holophagales bacterium]|nr:DUF6289 family protein [Holophagales bacterium]
MFNIGQNSSVLRRVVAAFVLVGALTATVALLPVEETEAAPTRIVQFFYFSDPSRSELVGFREYTCYHGTNSWGQVTPYFHRNEEPCE